MSEDVTRSARPHVNLEGFRERVLLQVELMRYDAQLRNFTPLRDRLVASGQDANARYRQIQSRRDQVMGKLKKLTPTPVRPAAAEASVRLPDPGSLLSLPITPANFHGGWFGYSGTVQMGRAHEGIDVIPPETTGSIRTLLLSDDGAITFGGDIVANPVDGQPKENLSLHSWTYLIPFPLPPALVGGLSTLASTTFTYSFRVQIEVAIAMIRGPSILPTRFWSFIAVGETANFVGQEVVVNANAGWPLIADLNGVPDYSELFGTSDVRRSFVVQSGHSPAVAVALGVVIALESGAEVHFDNGGACLILPGSVGVEQFNFGLVNFRYDPTRPVTKG